MYILRYHLTDDVHVQHENSKERFDNVELVSDEGLQSYAVSRRDAIEVNVFPGLLKIVIFSYQTNVLFKVYTGSKLSDFVIISISRSNIHFL